MTSTSCPPGTGPDFLLRLAMPVGPFNEPFAQDCHFHLATFQALGSIVIVANAIFLAIIVIDFFPRRGDVLMQFASLALVVLCTSHIAFVLCGFYAPFACRAVYPLCILGAISFVFAFLFKMIFSGVHLLNNLGKKVTVLDMVGGGFLGMTLYALLAVSTALAVLGGVVSAALYSPGEDEAPALAALQVAYIGLAIWSLCIVYAQQVIASRFIVVVEAINASAQGIRAGGGGGMSPKIGGSAAAEDAPPSASLYAPPASPRQQQSAQSTELEALLYRFKLCKKFGPVAIPISVGLNLLHAFVLPPLSYLVLFHCLNTGFVGVVAWYGITPTKRRVRVLAKLTCGLSQRWPAQSRTGGGTGGGADSTTSKSDSKRQQQQRQQQQVLSSAAPPMSTIQLQA